MFMDSLNPMDLFTRGSNVGGSAPSFYGKELTRGLTAPLFKVSSDSYQLIFSGGSL
jgi:hypothetical protein